MRAEVAGRQSSASGAPCVVRELSAEKWIVRSRLAAKNIGTGASRMMRAVARAAADRSSRSTGRRARGSARSAAATVLPMSKHLPVAAQVALAATSAVALHLVGGVEAAGARRGSSPGRAPSRCRRSTRRARGRTGRRRRCRSTGANAAAAARTRRSCRARRRRRARGDSRGSGLRPAPVRGSRPVARRGGRGGGI